MSMPERKGAWMFFTSAVEAALPAHGVEEGVELVGRAETGRFGQGDLLDDLGLRLDLPNDLEFFAQARRRKLLGRSGVPVGLPVTEADSGR